MTDEQWRSHLVIRPRTRWTEWRVTDDERQYPTTTEDSMDTIDYAELNLRNSRMQEGEDRFIDLANPVFPRTYVAAERLAAQQRVDRRYNTPLEWDAAVRMAGASHELEHIEQQRVLSESVLYWLGGVHAVANIQTFREVMHGRGAQGVANRQVAVSRIVRSIAAAMEHGVPSDNHHHRMMAGRRWIAEQHGVSPDDLIPTLLVLHPITMVVSPLLDQTEVSTSVGVRWRIDR